MDMRLGGARPAPSSGWLEEERRTKPMKEVSAAVGSSKIFVTKAVAEAGGKKRTMMVRVKQAYIDMLMEHEYPFEPFRGDPEELEKHIANPAKREELRILLAPVAALLKATRDKDEAIVKQYLAQGFAEEEVEVRDDEEA